MLRPQGLLPDRQRPLVMRLCLGVLGVGAMTVSPYEHGDAADPDARIRCPLLVLWGDRGGKAERRFNFLDIWRDRADDVRGGPIPCGHFLAEEAPDESYRALHDFLGA